MIISSYQTSLQGVKKSYAGAIQGMDYTLSLNFQSMTRKSKVGEVALDKFNCKNPLVEALLAKLEENEKTVIMTRKKQIGVVTICDMLSKFKKDLLKCLESYLVGWTPLSDVVNQAKKCAIIGQPKLRKEKLKPLIKLTYLRNKSARPTTCWQKIARPESTMKHGLDLGFVQAIKFSGAMRILEKGEKSGVGPSPTFLVSMVIW
jgi:hypothetical protein